MTASKFSWQQYKWQMEDTVGGEWDTVSQVEASRWHGSAMAYPFMKGEWFKKHRQDKSLLFCFELNKC